MPRNGYDAHRASSNTPDTTRTAAEDRDRVARLGTRRAPQDGTTAGLARRLAGFRGHRGGEAQAGSKRFTGGAGRLILRDRAHAQRVVVKTHYVRHPRSAGATAFADGGARTRGAIGAHARYLARGSATLAPGSNLATDLGISTGGFYDAHRDGLDARPIVAGWADDRHHFRVIVSPERAADLPDLTAYVREVVRRWATDLDVPTGQLQWLAVNHHNTDNPHAHVLIRGIRPVPEKGADAVRDLVIARHYIGYGMRQRAREHATELLGPRTEAQITQGLARVVREERYTALDRMIERAVEPRDGALTFDASPQRTVGMEGEHRDLAVGRLAVLKQMGLARSPDDMRRRYGATAWVLEPGWSAQLQDLGDRQDVVRQLYQTLGSEAAHLAGRVERMSAPAAEVGVVRGVVVARGHPPHEHDVPGLPAVPGAVPGALPGILPGAGVGRAASDPEPFLVVRDARGRLHHARVRSDTELDAAPVGSVVELGRHRAQRDAMVHAVLEVAGRHDGRYTAAQHEAHLAKTRRDFTAADRTPFVRSHVRRLDGLSKLDASGVSRQEDGSYLVQLDQLRRFHERGQRGPWARVDLYVLSPVSLEQQARALAPTWLDRQLYAFSRARRDGRAFESPGAEIERAMAERARWLVGRGYARIASEPTAPGGLPDVPGVPALRFTPRVLDRLAAIEATAMRQSIARESQQAVRELAIDDRAEGRLIAVRHLHQGRFVVVEHEQGLTVAPVRKSPPLAIGTAVQVERVNDRMSVLTRAGGTSRPQRGDRTPSRGGRQEERE